MAKYALAIDVTKCNGCYNCFVACKDEFDTNDYLPVSVAQPDGGADWIRLKEVEYGTGWKVKVDYVPIMCQHCENPVCATAAPDGAVYTREDGIVVIDPVKAKGNKDLVNACPYRAIFWNEEKQVAQKCTMCAHMLDNGEKTVRCAEACPTGALMFGDTEDPNSEISKFLAGNKDKLESLMPEHDTKPVTQYMGLPKTFVAGEVVFSDQEKDCAGGVKVVLKTADGNPVAETVTDFLGDFEFTSLENNQEYVVVVEHAGYGSEEVSVKTNASKNLGEIVLQAQ